ncbi:MAG: hypothetical protein J0M34_02650 [Alphaproteobacteria bacterium]|nr:hypothetical protein [Alphaproteobacteria bacterium]
MVQQLTPPAPLNTLVSIQPVTISVNAQDVAKPLLENVAVGAILQGYVVNRDAQQNPILRTTIGDVLVKSELFLKTGSEVVIRVDAAIESRARILTIDGLSPQDYVARTTAAPSLSDTILNSSLLPQSQALPSTTNPAATTAPIVLPAVLLSSNILIPEGLPPEVAQYWTQMVASLQKDVNVAVKILATELPLPNEAPSQQAPITAATIKDAPVINPPTVSNISTAPIPNAAAINPPPAPITANVTATPARLDKAATPATSAPITVTGTAVSASSASTPSVVPTTNSPVIIPATTAPISTAPTTPPIIVNAAATPQKQPTTETVLPQAISKPVAIPHSAPASSTAPIPTVTAQVIGHEMDGASIIQSPLGTFKLLTAQPLPTGTKLTLEIAPQSPQRSTAPIAPLLPTDLEELTSLARDWHSVRDAITAISAQDPALATQLIQNILPKPHVKLTNEMLFLFSAIKSGNPEQWFGKRAIEILDMSSPEILKRLSREFAQLQQVFSDAIPQWMSVVMPFYSEAQIQHIRMFFKHEDESGKKASQGGGQRFLIEVDLSHLGELQLDGFVKKADAGKHFDLVIRSARHLPQEVEQQIRVIFENALQTTGYKGYMHFQQGIQHFVRPMEAIKEAMHGDKNTILA